MYNQFLQGIFVKDFQQPVNSSGSSIPSLVLMEISIFRFSNRLSRNRSRASRSSQNPEPFFLDTTVGRGTAQIQIYFLVAELTEFFLPLRMKSSALLVRDLGEPHAFPHYARQNIIFSLEFRVLSSV